jgi:hypothetical protein
LVIIEISHGMSLKLRNLLHQIHRTIFLSDEFLIARTVEDSLLK